MRLVVDTSDLRTLQRHATDLGRERDLKARITRMRRSKAWGELGDLKRELLDLWTEERNTLAKAVMQDIEAPSSWRASRSIWRRRGSECRVMSDQ